MILGQFFKIKSIFQIKNREQPYQAELEFFNELILDIDKKFKEISSSKITFAGISLFAILQKMQSFIKSSPI